MRERDVMIGESFSSELSYFYKGVVNMLSVYLDRSIVSILE